MLGKGKGKRHPEGRKHNGQAGVSEGWVDDMHPRDCPCRTCRRVRVARERRRSRP